MTALVGGKLTKIIDAELEISNQVYKDIDGHIIN